MTGIYENYTEKGTWGDYQFKWRGDGVIVYDYVGPMTTLPVPLPLPLDRPGDRLQPVPINPNGPIVIPPYPIDPMRLGPLGGRT